jgi:hypothetical protein
MERQARSAGSVSKMLTQTSIMSEVDGGGRTAHRPLRSGIQGDLDQSAY